MNFQHKQLAEKNWVKLSFCQQMANVGSEVERAIKWNGGSSFEPYPISWTTQLKESIRIRDEHICQICGKTTKQNGRKLDIHHIDYTKENLDIENLISLCHSCHTKTNYNREIYIEFFKILSNIIK